MKKLIAFLLLVILLTTAACAENKYDLPISLTPGYEPNPACYSEDGYEDDSVTVKMEKIYL